jgi:hypothetical protein
MPSHVATHARFSRGLLGCAQPAARRTRGSTLPTRRPSSRTCHPQ